MVRYFLIRSGIKDNRLSLVLDQEDKTESSNSTIERKAVEIPEAKAQASSEKLIEDVEHKFEHAGATSAEELYIKSLEQKLDEIYEKSKSHEIKAWRNDFKSCFRNSADNRMMHINFKQVKPVPKDAVGEKLIKNEKLWLLWFKIAGEICGMEEILDLFKEAIKLHLPNIRLLKTEFDLFFAEFLNGTQLKSPPSQMQDSAQGPECILHSDKKSNNYTTEEDEMRAHYRQVAKALRSGEPSGTGTPFSSRSKSSRRQRSAKKDSSKRKRAEFEKSQEFFPERHSEKRREKVFNEQQGNNEPSADAESIIQLSSYTYDNLSPYSNMNASEKLQLDGSNYKPSTPVRKSPGLKPRRGLILDKNDNAHSPSKNKRLSVKFTDKVEEIDETGHVCYTEEALLLQDESTTHGRKLERQQTPYSKSNDSAIPGPAESTDESELEEGFFLDPTKNIAFGFEKEMQKHEKDAADVEEDEGKFTLLDEKSFVVEPGRSPSFGMQFNGITQMNGKYPYLKPRPKETENMDCSRENGMPGTFAKQP